MKTLKVIFLVSVFAFSYDSLAQLSTNCLPDKGIKKAVVSKAYSEGNITIEEMFYDEDGRLLLKKRPSSNNSELKYVYDGVKLLYKVSFKKNVPFFPKENRDSLLAIAPVKTDTIFILEHYENGEVKTILISEDIKRVFFYNGCEAVIHASVSSKGDTIQKAELFFQEELLQKVILTENRNGDYMYIMNYYGYKLNKQGHWIERKSRGSGNELVETRKLEYY